MQHAKKKLLILASYHNVSSQIGEGAESANDTIVILQNIITLTTTCVFLLYSYLIDVAKQFETKNSTDNCVIACLANNQNCY
jgi:hypothetical protein